MANAYSLWTSDTTTNPGLFGGGDGTTTMELPDWTGRMAQFAATAGGKVDAGLPNITGNTSNLYIRTAATVAKDYGAGAVATCPLSIGYGAYSGADQYCFDIEFDASRSNPIYSASQTVQPPAINVYPIMRY